MDDSLYIRICIEEAVKASERGEVPVGAILVLGDEIISKAHNLTRSTLRPTAHAEILAIEEAAKILGNFRLKEATLYVTKEPCIMCAGAIVEARIRRLVFGCHDVRRGAFGSVINVNELSLNHRVQLEGGVLEEECSSLLRQFFKARRGTEVAITGPTRNRLYA